MLLSHATVEECARAALAHEDPAADFDALPDAVKRECLNYARHILSGGTPAEWHDMGIDRIALPGWTYGPEKNLVAKTAPYLARFNDLPADVRADREAVADVIHATHTAIRERHEAEKRAAEAKAAHEAWRAEHPDEAAAEDARIEAERAAADHAKWREDNPELAAEKDRQDAEAQAAERERAAQAETEAPPAEAPVADEAVTTEIPPAPEAVPEAPAEPPPAPLATSRRSRR